MVPPAHTVPVPADAVMEGSARTVTVIGTLTEEQPVVLLVTTRLKSYTPAGALEGILIVAGEPDKVAFVIVENPGIARTPAVRVYLSGLDVEEYTRLKLLLPKQVVAFVGVIVGVGLISTETFPDGLLLVQYASETALIA